MQYVRISFLRSQFSTFSFPLSESDATAFRSEFYASETGKAMNVYESEQWLLYLQQPQYVLFQEWTEQESTLTDVLEGKPLLRRFRGVARFQQHALFPDYQSFITPFVYPKLEQAVRNATPAVWNTALSFVPLLREREADLLQGSVYEQLTEHRTALAAACAQAKSEEALAKLVRPYVEPDFIELLNGFTASFYRAKTTWMETLVGLAHHPANSKPFLLYLIGKLQQLQLNPDHLDELRTLEKDIRKGELKVEETPFPWKTTMYIGGILLVFGVIAYLIMAMPSDVEQEKLDEKTAYMSFSVGERRALDSLLEQVKTEQEQPSDAIDQAFLPYVGVDLVQKIPWKNQTIEYLFEHWQNSDTSNQRPMASESKKETRIFPMTENLQQRTGGTRVQFKNDTEQSVLLLVFDNVTNGYVYSSYVEKGSLINFRVNHEEYLFCLPGTKVPKDLHPEQLPFDQVDSRFFRHLGDGYQIDPYGPSALKLVWKEVNAYDFYLLDINSGLNKP